MLRIQRLILFGAALATSAIPAMAQETSFSVSVGATYSDNIGRVGSDEESDLMPEAGMRFSVSREGRLDLALDGDLTYRSYQESTFTNDDELVGGLDARIGYAFVPDRFDWVVQNNFGQALIDPQAVETVDNRQNMNYFSTGPDFTIPLGGRTSLAVSGRWSDLDFEENDFGNERLSGTLGIIRHLGGMNSLHLGLASQRVEFDGPVPAGYDVHSAFLMFQAGSSRTQLEVRGGATEVHDAGDTFQHPLVSVTLTRQLTERSSLTLVAGTGMTDSADAFRRDRDIAGVGGIGEDVLALPDIVKEDFATVQWTVGSGRTTFEASVNWRDEDRELVSDFSRQSLELAVNIARRVGPRLTARVYGWSQDTDYDRAGIQYEEWLAGVGFDWSLSSRYGLAISAEHRNAGGGTSAGPGTRDYEENRYSLRISYSIGR